MKTVDIYTIPDSPYCAMAKQFLTKHRISYQEYDVSKDMAARERMIAVSHQKGVPVIDLGDEVFVGFSRADLEKAFGVR